MKKFNSNHFGINYDTGNSASRILIQSKNLKNMENISKIFIKKTKKIWKTVPFGQGNTNFKLIFNLCKINFKGNMILQGARKVLAKRR